MKSYDDAILIAGQISAWAEDKYTPDVLAKLVAEIYEKPRTDVHAAIAISADSELKVD